MPASVLATQRIVLAASVVLTGCLFVPALADPVNVIKLTVLSVAALVLVGLSAYAAIRTRVIHVPRSPSAWAALALLVALAISAGTAPNLTRAVVGTYGRNSGLLAYGSALVLFFIGLRAWGQSAHLLPLALILSGAFTAGYGLLQYVGVDPIAWNNPYNPIVAALGNPDFAAAYLGMCAPAACWGALRREWGLPWRAASGVIAVMCGAAMLLSHAVQGPLAAAAGLSVLAAAALLNRGGAVARRGLTALAAAAAAGVAVLSVGWAGAGPAAPLFSQYGFKARGFYWDGAATMFSRHPLLGVGLDHYGAYWREVRSDAATRFLGGTSYSDAAHSVPLQMLAQGGLVLGLAYVAFLITIGVALLQGLRRLEGSARLLLGAVGGSWVAYVVSSAVSIDQVPLLVVEFVAASAVVAVAGLGWREVRLPGALSVVEPARARRGRAPARPRERERRWSSSDLWLAGGVGIVLLTLLWFSMTPMRANAAARQGDVALSQGKGNAAVDAYRQASDLLPGEGTYWGRSGSLYENVKQPALALEMYEAGVRHDPFDETLLTGAARLSGEAGKTNAAVRYWKRAAHFDPSNPDLAAQAATFLAAYGAGEDALTILARPLALFPDSAALWAATGDARIAAKDTAGGRRAYAKALTLDAQNEVAKSGLAKLPGPLAAHAAQQ